MAILAEKGSKANILLTYFIIDFQRSKGESTFSEKNLNFSYVSSGVYLITKCGKSGIKAVHNYKNDNFVITRGRQNVTSESTPSGILTSYVLNATMWFFFL